jgi:hypothetical protein
VIGVRAFVHRFGQSRSEVLVESRAWSVAVPAVAAAAAWIFGLVTLWFTEAPPISDDQGLFNATYTFLTTGHMAYPIYAGTDTDSVMYVHPPTHYALLAGVMRITGMTAEASAVALILFWLAVGLGLVVATRLSAAAKLALIAGFTAVLVVWARPWFIRPELDLIGAGFCGLIALEVARGRDWNLPLLVLGALLLSGAAAMHYPFAALFGGVVVYAAWVVFERRRAALKALAALALGSAAVLVPFAVLFVIPDWPLIRLVARVVQEQQATLPALAQHREAYESFSHERLGGSLLHAISLPFTSTGVPVVFAAMPLLLVRRETRVLAAACLPQLLFFLFYVKWKLPSAINYYLFEFLIYYVAVAYALLLVVGFLLSRGPQSLRRWSVPAVAFAGLAVVGSVIGLTKPEIYRTGLRNWHPMHAEMDVARAATGTLLPPNALILNNPTVSTWYTSGASRVYPLWRDLTFQQDLSSLNVRAYLSHFTAVADGTPDWWGSTLAYNKQHEAVPTWVARRLLRPYRFYFGDRFRATDGPPLRYVLFSTARHALAGTTRRGRTLFRYRQEPGGAYAYVSEICAAKASFLQTVAVPERTIMYLPPPGPPPVSGAAPSKTGVITYVASQSVVTKLARRARAARCRMLDRIPLTRTTVSATALLERWRETGGKRTIRFPSFVTAANAIYYPKVRTTRTPEPSLSDATLADGSRAGQAVTIEAPAAGGSPALVLNLPAAERPMWVELDGVIRDGSFLYCIYDTVAPKCLAQRLLNKGASGRFFLSVPESRHPLQLVVFRQEGDPARMTISALHVHAA